MVHKPQSLTFPGELRDIARFKDLDAGTIESPRRAIIADANQF